MIATDYIFGRKNNLPQATNVNTFIGGVAASLNTASALATKLQINEVDITVFNIVGNDLEVRINTPYQIPANCFQDNLNITHYKETENICTYINAYSFFGALNMLKAEFIGDTGVTTQAFRNCPAEVILKDTTAVGAFAYLSTGKLFYLPKCTNLGGTAGNNNAFGQVSGATVYVHPSLETCNGGAPDGDLQEVITNGGTVRYVTDYTPPATITNLSLSTTFAGSIQVNFTPPASISGLDYYEVYVNGNYHAKIKNSGDYITGLQKGTNYSVYVIAVDMSYNKSDASNTDAITTETQANTRTANLTTYLEFEGNALDTQGNRNGNLTGFTFDPNGVKGQALSCNGNGTVNLGTVDLLGNSTVCIWAKPSNTGRRVLFEGGNYNTWGTMMQWDNGLLNWSSPGAGASVANALAVNQPIFIALVRDVTNGKVQIYVNGFLAAENKNASAPIPSGGPFEIGAGYQPTDWQGLLDEFRIYEAVIEPHEIYELTQV